MNKEMWGVTGPMGSGKSEVAKRLAKHVEIKHLDCDKTIKDFFGSNDYMNSLEEILGESVRENGIVIKSKIAKIIFNDIEKKKAVEDFNYPLLCEKIVEEVKNMDNNSILLVEAVILFNSPLQNDFEKVILVKCSDKKVQIERIKNRNPNWSLEQIEERLKNQHFGEEEEKLSRIIINNDGSSEELDKKLDRVFEFLINKETGRLEV